jgi:hypothetical protein
LKPYSFVIIIPITVMKVYNTFLETIYDMYQTYLRIEGNKAELSEAINTAASVLTPGLSLKLGLEGEYKEYTCSDEYVF